MTETSQFAATVDAQPVSAGRTSEEVQAEYVQRIALGQLGEPNDIAADAEFPLSDDARYITGQALNDCDGVVMS